MSKWYDLYVKRLNSDYRSYMAKRYGEFLWEVLSRITSKGMYGEFGCGAGNITRLLLEQSGVEYSTFVLLDIDEQMLELTRKNLGELDTNNNILIGQGDILHGSGCLVAVYVTPLGEIDLQL
jgi:ubiquinone/menaquinone biosynthesis C-methylase UbiE